MSKERFAALSAEDRMAQTGCAYIGGPFEIPDLSAEFASLTEPIIETFIVDVDQSCTATGADAALIEATAPLAEEMAARTMAALAAVGVDLVSPGYLTASVSPIDQVTSLAHFDDDQYVPNDGVGAVAIAGCGNGPRLAIDPVPHRPLRSNLPVEVSNEVIDGFGSDPAGVQQVAPNRIVVFPQFGQLHSGRVIHEPIGDETVRTLLVFRLGTRPTVS